jgi:pantoate--beta-alanine ligase
MKIIESITQMQQHANHLRDKGDRVGFVPTMGYLHEGHLSLLRRAIEENHALVVSIFVNPIQFGPDEDYGSYPRDMEKDISLCRDEGCDVLFSPSAQEMYPEGAGTKVAVSGLTEGLCGASRPGHFDGVTTVVAKLFNIVKPHIAYFGLKDYQQYKVICRMVRDLNMDIRITGLPIVREPDGLAMSSRNSYLTAEERAEAVSLPQSLQFAQKLFEEGIRDVAVLESKVRDFIESGKHTRIDYVSVVDAEELTPIKVIEDRALLALSVFIGKARLIDNRILGTDRLIVDQ